MLFARNWALGIHLSDSGIAGPVTFERIGVLYPQTSIAPHMNRQCIKLNIGRDEWGNDDQCGHIRNITFRDINITGHNVPPMLFHGFDAEHVIEDVTFENLRINGKTITSTNEHSCEVNEHVRGLNFS